MLQQTAGEPIVPSIRESVFMRTVFCLAASVLLLCGSSFGCFVRGDFNGDCAVELDDLAVLASQWLGASACENDTGLVLHWQLNEVSGSTAADSSGTGRTGTVFEAAWNPLGGRLAGALEFDGTDDYIHANGFFGITGTHPRSCAAWIKTDRPSGCIMVWGSALQSRLWYIGVDERGALRVDVGGGFVIGTTLLTDDIWHHIAVTSDGTITGSIALYVDGKLETIAEAAQEAVNTYATSYVTLGKYPGRMFRGLIDEARVYSRVLSLQEVWNLAGTGTAVSDCADMNMDAAVNLADAAELARYWTDAAPQVTVSEFLADNKSISPLEAGEILDGNGESSDWIEIHNNSGLAVNIGGWYLTDDAGVKTKWRFPVGLPQLQLPPGAYLVVFASGKTLSENPSNYPYVDPAGYLHTNFSLSDNGEYLGLFAADGLTPVHQYDHVNLGDEYGYPPQDTNISYGCFYDEHRYFTVPTPGADNTRGSFEEAVEKPDVNVKGGCCTDAFDLVLTSAVDGAFIRYTTNGTVPTLTNGFEYTAPIHLDSTTTILARAFKAGMQPSDTRIDTYIFVDPAISPSNTNLPIVVVDTLGQPVPSDPVNKPYIDCRVVIVDVDKMTGRAQVTGSEHFEGWAMIRRRGESTYNSNHYALEIQDELRLDKKVSLLGMPAESDWILSWDVLDYTMMKNEMAFAWFRDMGHYAPRQRYVEMYLNTDGGRVGGDDYLGLFMLREKIKRDDNRTDIARLDASHNLEPKVSGGYIIKSDKYDAGSTLLADGPEGIVEPDYLESAPYGIQVTGAGKPILEEPDSPTVTQPQVNWIASYLNTVSATLWQNTASEYYPGPEMKYTDYIDAASWIDHGLLEQICMDSDAFWGSYYTYKDRGGKIHSGPPWDYDRGFHNNAEAYGQPYNYWKENAAIFGKWHQKLQGDPEYKLMLADRWFGHRRNVLDTDAVLTSIDDRAALISEARSRPKKYYPKPFAVEVQLFKAWISNRLSWLDMYIADRFAPRPAVVSPSGGHVSAGVSLVISKPQGLAGDIYYTLNGEDPRLAGGAVNPNALLYTATGGTFTETVVRMGFSPWTYLYDGADQGTAWQLLSFDDSAWQAGPGQLGFGDNDEATNIGPRVFGRRTAYFRHQLNIAEVSQITAIDITLLHDDGAVVYINGQEVGRVFMPAGSIYFDTPAAVQGENTITVFNGISAAVLNEGDNIIAVEVHQRTDNSSDVSFDMALDVTRTVQPTQVTLDKSVCIKTRIMDQNSWSAMSTDTYAVGPGLETIRISEIMYHPAGPTPAETAQVGNPNLADEDFEFIELTNTGTAAINLDLLRFTDGIDFTFGDFTLAAGGCAMLVKNSAAFEARYGPGISIIPGTYAGSLDNGGEEIVLRDAIGTEIHDFDYDDTWYELTDGQGFSLTVRDPAAGDIELWDARVGWRSSLYAGGTPGRPSETVLPAGSIVINEVLAHSHGSEPDWIELYNTTDQAIDIGDWFLSDSSQDDPNIMKYRIAPETVIDAHGFMLFAEDTTFGNPSSDGCNKPFGLSKGGETVYLYSGQSGQVTGYYQTEENFDASETGISFGRYEKAELSGGYDFARLTRQTPDAANSGPLIPDVVITEIYYHPSEGPDYEFIELHNRSASAVILETQVSTETAPGVFVTQTVPWRLEGTGYEFQPGTVIAAGSRIIVAKNPAFYPGSYGPYDGKLDNGGEEIQIQVPGDQEYGKSRYWIPIEEVDYDDTDPWPVSADGGGDSLNRINPGSYSRDYSNWESMVPTPGY